MPFFQSEYCDLKKKSEDACKKLEEDINQTVALMQTREEAYGEYIQQSEAQYTPGHTPKAQTQGSGGGGGRAERIRKRFG